jgi:hypothetical protein
MMLGLLRRKDDRKLLSAEAQSAAYALQQTIERLEAIDPQEIEGRFDPAVQNASKVVRRSLVSVFGYGSPTYRRYKEAIRLDRMPCMYGEAVPVDIVQEQFIEDRAVSIAILRQAVAELRARAGTLPEA